MWRKEWWFPNSVVRAQCRWFYSFITVTKPQTLHEQWVMSTILPAVTFSGPRVGTFALMGICGCTGMREEDIWHWGFLIKSRTYGHFSCVVQQSAGLKAETPKPFTRRSEFAACSLPSATLAAPLWVFWLHYCDYIISSSQLIFCLESWNWLLHFTFFLHLSTIVLFFFERSGETNPTVLLFIKFHGQERKYQKCEVGGGGRSN